MKGPVLPEVGNAEVLLHLRGARSETAVCDLRGRKGLFIGPGGRTDKRGKGPGSAPRPPSSPLRVPVSNEQKSDRPFAPPAVLCVSGVSRMTWAR